MEVLLVRGRPAVTLAGHRDIVPGGRRRLRHHSRRRVIRTQNDPSI